MSAWRSPLSASSVTTEALRPCLTISAERAVRARPRGVGASRKTVPTRRPQGSDMPGGSDRHRVEGFFMRSTTPGRNDSSTRGRPCLRYGGVGATMSYRRWSTRGEERGILGSTTLTAGSRAVGVVQLADLSSASSAHPWTIHSGWGASLLHLRRSTQAMFVCLPRQSVARVSELVQTRPPVSLATRTPRRTRRILDEVSSGPRLDSIARF